MAGSGQAQTFQQIAKARGLPVAKAASNVSMPFEVLKSAPEQRMVWGWVSVSTVDGQPVVDVQGDVIPVDVLEKAAHDYLRDSRAGKRQHTGPQTAELVESIVFTAEKQAALGIDLGREGWFCGFHVTDDAHWAAVKAGQLPDFSIGGTGTRVPMEA